MESIRNKMVPKSQDEILKVLCPAKLHTNNGFKMIKNLEGSGHYSGGANSASCLTRPATNEEIDNELSKIGITLDSNVPEDVRKELIDILTHRSDNPIASGHFIFPPEIPHNGGEKQNWVTVWYYELV